MSVDRITPLFLDGKIYLLYHVCHDLCMNTFNSLSFKKEIPLATFDGINSIS